jgi:hypothetical protein
VVAYQKLLVANIDKHEDSKMILMCAYSIQYVLVVAHQAWIAVGRLLNYLYEINEPLPEP